MMVKKFQDKRYKITKIIRYVGLALFFVTLALSSLLLIIDPTGLDVRAMTVPVLMALFIGGLGIGYSIASRGGSRVFSAIGASALAILFTFIGFFLIAAVAWWVAVSQV